MASQSCATSRTRMSPGPTHTLNVLYKPGDRSHIILLPVDLGEILAAIGKRTIAACRNMMANAERPCVPPVFLPSAKNSSPYLYQHIPLASPPTIRTPLQRTATAQRFAGTREPHRKLPFHGGCRLRCSSRLALRRRAKRTLLREEAARDVHHTRER